MAITATKRLQEIVDLLDQKGYVKAKELSPKYQVSMETIRKDLTFLEEKGVVKKEYGGATLATLGAEKNIEFREKQKYDEKKEIARCISSILMAHNSMIIDSGSTCQSCCSYINLMPSKDIFTVSIGAFEQLDGNLHNVFLTPGKKREKNQSIVGHWSEEYLDKVQVDVCVLGTSGLLNSDGPTCHSYQELGVKKKMIEKSDYVFVVADSSKFQEKGLYTVCSWEEIDGIITDYRISTKVYEDLSQKVSVYIGKKE